MQLTTLGKRVDSFLKIPILLSVTKKVDKKYKVKLYPDRFREWAFLRDSYELMDMSYFCKFIMIKSLKENIIILNGRLFNSIQGNYPFGLAHGKMGLVIYFLHLHLHNGEIYYKEEAYRLLDDLLEKGLSANNRLAVEDGLCGVGLGLDYIIQKEFVSGNINELLGEIDDLLFNAIVFKNLQSSYSLPELIHLLYYIHERMKPQTVKDNIFIFEELAIKLVNKLSSLLDTSFYSEPHTFSVYHYHVPILMRVLGHFLHQNFYRERILKILESISLNLFTHLPRLHLNRLYLLWSILSLCDISPEWQQYINRLKINIDLNIIYKQEIKDRNIYMSNGFPFLYFLLEHLKCYSPEYDFDFDPRFIYDRIVSSDAWNALLNDCYYYDIHRGILNGFPGTVLTLLDIENKYL